MIRARCRPGDVVVGALIVKRRVAGAFAALNRRDLDAFLRDWSDDASKVFPGDLSVSGTFSGKAKIREWYEGFFRQFPSLRFAVRNICVERMWDVIGSNVVAARWEIDLTNGIGGRSQNSGVTIITVERGKVVHVHDYIFDTGQPFREVWGEAEPG
jgi:ketosteroid isomerase-like protein